MNPNVNDSNKYLILLDAEGNRADTKLACEYSDEGIADFIKSGYLVVSEEKFSLIIGNDPEGKMWDLQPDGSIKERPPYVPSIEELQANKLNEAGAEFAKRRDAIRWVQVSDGNAYGFDCASEDITNFMAAWKAAEVDGYTGYKVWFTETTNCLTSKPYSTSFATANWLHMLGMKKFLHASKQPPRLKNWKTLHGDKPRTRLYVSVLGIPILFCS